MSDQKERAPELTQEVDRKLSDIDEKLGHIDDTLVDVKADLRAWRKALVKFYATQDVRHEGPNAER